MKAYRITSTEYRGNTPSVFIFAEGSYYGDLAYPRRDNFPRSIDHWKSAECADAGRFFNINVVTLGDDQERELQRLQTAREVVNSMTVGYTPWRPGMTAAEIEADRQENARREKMNAPFYHVAGEIERSIDNIIKGLQ